VWGDPNEKNLHENTRRQNGKMGALGETGKKHRLQLEMALGSQNMKLTLKKDQIPWKNRVGGGLSEPKTSGELGKKLP